MSEKDESHCCANPFLCMFNNSSGLAIRDSSFLKHNQFWKRLGMNNISALNII
jgi:hypothetical protein